MKEKIIVSNTTPLIGLMRIKRLELLPQLFKQIIIAEGVYREVVDYDRKEADLIKSADWLEVIKVKDKLAVEVLLDELDIGESETIVLSREVSADIVLIDERKARRKVKQLGFNLSGTVGVLLLAKKKGMIDEIKPELDGLHRNSFYISESLRQHALRISGE